LATGAATKLSSPDDDLVTLAPMRLSVNPPSIHMDLRVDSNQQPSG
jgi:hypothetical protein